MDPLRRLPASVRPVQFELPKNYLRRICQANAVDHEWILEVVRRRQKASSASDELGQVLHELGGPPAATWIAEHQRASLGMSRVRSPFQRQPDARVACTRCTAGASVSTFDHIRFSVCVKHSRWIGPGTGPTTQRQLDPGAKAVDADRALRALVSRGQVDEMMRHLAWHAVRDYAYTTGVWRARLDSALDDPSFTREVDDAIALYPETVRLLGVLVTLRYRDIVNEGALSPTARRAHLFEALDWLPAERWMVCDTIERHFGLKFNLLSVVAARPIARRLSEPRPN